MTAEIDPNRFRSRARANGLRIPGSVVSKTIDLGDSGVHSIAYNTRRQTIAVFEGDSASVWRLLYENNGNVGAALEYIRRNGTFEADPDIEARETLAEFIEELQALQLGEGPEGTHESPDRHPATIGSSSNGDIDEGARTEAAFAAMMVDHHVFYQLAVELTYRCNETCVHCYCPADRVRPELTLSQIEDLLDEFQALGGFSLLLTGGEVFVREDFRHLLRSLKRRKLLLSIISNLTLLDADSADLISDLHPRSVGCSIYSANADLHDSITRHPDSFKKSVAAIKMLRARGVPVVIKTPLLASTAQMWREVVALGTDLGCENQFDLNITARNDGDTSPALHRVNNEDVLADILRHAFPRVVFGEERLADSASADTSVGLCGAGATGLTVSPDGTIRPCISLTQGIGVWPADSLADVWSKSPFFSEWASRTLLGVSKCASCRVSRFCIRCPGAWLTEAGSPLKPSDYSCRLAEIRSRIHESTE